MKNIKEPVLPNASFEIVITPELLKRNYEIDSQYYSIDKKIIEPEESKTKNKSKVEETKIKNDFEIVSQTNEFPITCKGPCKIYYSNNLVSCKIEIKDYSISIYDDQNKPQIQNLNLNNINSNTYTNNNNNNTPLLYYSIPLLSIKDYSRVQVDFKTSSEKYYKFSLNLKSYKEIIFFIDVNLINLYENIIKALEYYKSSNDQSVFYRYSFWYKQSITEKNNFNQKNKIDGWTIYNMEDEFKRQNVDLNSTFTVFKNKNYSTCESYPLKFIIPHSIKEDIIIGCSKFRGKNRVPALTYRYKNSSCIWRGSQTLSGWNAKNDDDVTLITQISSKEKKLTIYDARPWTSANANRIMGGGYENPNHYTNCTVINEFCNMENIHNVRKSLKKLYQTVISDDNSKKTKRNDNLNVNQNNKNYGLNIGFFGTNNADDKYSNANTTDEYKTYFNKIDNSFWYAYIYYLLKASFDIAFDLTSEKHHSVLIHCTDGWDRTPQLCATSQILIDSYYRTIKGFIVLIEKDFLSFGHQFGKRCGYYLSTDKDEQRSPIFLQWLDAIYQLLVQNISKFEFNIDFLVYLAIEVYSGKYGTFLFNCEKERDSYKAKKTTVSVWNYVYENIERFINPLYNEKDNEGCCLLDFSFNKIKLWNEYFYKNFDFYTDEGYINKLETIVKKEKDELEKERQNMKEITGELIDFICSNKNKNKAKDLNLSDKCMEYIKNNFLDKFEKFCFDSFIFVDKESCINSSSCNDCNDDCFQIMEISKDFAKSKTYKK